MALHATLTHIARYKNDLHRVKYDDSKTLFSLFELKRKLNAIDCECVSAKAP